MNSKSNFDTRGKIVALLAPILSAALFAGITIGIDIASEKETNFLGAAYLFKIMLTASAGALASAALVAARAIIIAAQTSEASYLKIPWKLDSRSRSAQNAKIDTLTSMRELFDVVESRVTKGIPESLALRTVHVQIEEQKENLEKFDRIQFITPTPQNRALLENELVSKSLRPDGYGLVENAAEAGDIVQATDFQNSNFWWLNRKIAFDFFELNLQLLRRGVQIERIFGCNHPIWHEDETGTKKALIELQARIKGMGVYTINYNDFKAARGLNIKATDQLCLIRRNSVLPSIEWIIDETGNTDKVFYVFGRGHLEEMRQNYAAIKNSAARGSSLLKIEMEPEFDVRTEDGYNNAKRAFSEIANSSPQVV